MSPWISIAISVVTTVVVGLVGFIVKRELGRVATDLTAIREAHAAEVTARQKALETIASDLKAFVATCEDKYLSKEMFNRLEVSRREVDQLRRDQDGRLESLIKSLLSQYGGQGGA